ncbi:MAG: hypothetical protein WCT45_02605 [Candidatus Paceibacterota bacterium]
MTIAEAREKCKKALAGVPRDGLVFAIIFLASLASFALGYFAGRDSGAPTSLFDSRPVTTSEAVAEPATAGNAPVVASKNGTKYYLPTCAGAARIAEGNKVQFASAEAARAAGYAPAANCKGL